MENSINATQHELLRGRGLERHAEQIKRHEDALRDHHRAFQAEESRWQALRGNVISARSQRIREEDRQREPATVDGERELKQRDHMRVILTERTPRDEKEGGEELRALEMQIQTTREGLEASAGEDEIARLRHESHARLSLFLRKRREYDLLRTDVEQTIRETTQHVLQDPSLESAEAAWSEVASQQRLRDEIVHAVDELSNENPESFLADSLLRLRQYKKELPSGIVETPDIKQVKDTVVEKLVKQRVVALVGETGTGKTRLARKIAEELTGDYEFIAGHAFLTKEDILYYLNLDAQEVRSEDLPRLIEEAKARYSALHPEITDQAALAAPFAMIERAEQGKAEQKTLRMETLLGPAFRAAEAGRILIYDEFNFSPPELLAGMYQLMEAKPGERVKVMGREITVAPGFGIVFTGNVTQADLQRYFNRKEMDPAFVNRLNSGLIEYNTPPQEHNLNLTTSIFSQEEKAGGQESPKRNLFLIGLAHLVDAKGNLVAPETALDQLWLLSMKFAILQKIFAGQQLQQFAPASGTRFNLNKYHASLRTFGAVLEQWKQDGFQYDLDWYLYNNLLRPSALIAPSETAQFFYLLQDGNAGFFQQAAWNRLQIDTNDWSMQGWEEAKQVPRESLRSSSTKKHFPPQEIAEAVAGVRMPEFPEEAASVEAQEAGEDRERMEQYRELEAMIAEEERIVEGLKESIQLFCDDERAIMGEEAA